MTNSEICEKNITDLTDEEFDKIFNIEGFCNNGTESATARESMNPDAHAAVYVLYPMLILSGVVLNCLVILTIILRRRLRTVPNAFMVSLSVSDFFMASIVVPLRLAELRGSSRANYSVLDLLFPLIGVASILSLCSVTLDRYIHIRNALNYEKYINKFRAIVVLTGIWIFAILQAIIVFFMVNRVKEMIYNDVRFVLCFCIPSLFIVFAYTKLFHVARAHSRVIASTNVAFPTSAQSTFKKDLKILKVIALIVGTFFTCWFPFFLLISYELHTEPHSHSFTLQIVMDVSECLACSTCVFNPLLYGFLQKDIRVSVKSVLARRDETINRFSGTGTQPGHLSCVSNEAN